jgi:N-acyl-D-aspartate/D-glutamate deacylase
VPTRLAADEERVALGRTLGEFNRGIIEILPKGAGKPSPADLDHLRDVAVASGRPVFFLSFDTNAWPYVEKASREGAQLFNLLRAIPFNPRFTLKKTTFFHNLDVWDVVMQLRPADRLAALADPERRAKMRDQALKPQRRRPGVPGRLVPWSSIFVRKVKLAKNQGLVDQSLTALAEKQNKHVADVMLDLALEEGLDTEFQLMTRSNEEETQIADMVKSGHALPTQSDAGAHLNTNFCTAGESSYVLGQWVRDRELLTLEDAIRRYTFQPARIMGLRDRGMIREGLAADLMVFDLASIGVKEDEVTLDGPSGTPRRVQGAEGVSHVVVGGQVVLEHGKHTGAFPGRVLRAGQH